MIKIKSQINHDLLPLLFQKSIDNMWQRIVYIRRMERTIGEREVSNDVRGDAQASWQQEPQPMFRGPIP